MGFNFSNFSDFKKEKLKTINDKKPLFAEKFSKAPQTALKD